jgi:nicotinamide-nucleotide amidase
MASCGPPVAEGLVALALSRGVMIATAESCTGGMVAAAITDVPGSSAVFERGIVTYSNRAKIDLLGVQADTLALYGAVSEQVASEMARGLLARSNAQITVSITGIAGPGGSDHKPEGRVCFGLAHGATVTTETVEFGAKGRAVVRRAAMNHALTLLSEAIRTMPEKQA